jgi:hypothetical protein
MKKKPIKVTKSLPLDKEIVSKLDEDQFDEASGGGTTNTCIGIPAPQVTEGLFDVHSCHACSCNN